MFRYMLEFKKSTDFNSSINYSLLNKELEKIEINSKTNLWLSHPTSSGETYFFSNAIIIGKLFKKSKNKSSKVVNKNKRIITIEELVKDFWGSYIAIIFDNENVEVFKDPACSFDFLWTINNENTIGFSDVEFYKKYSESNLEVNDKYVAASLCYERLNLRETGFKNISNLLSGESITLYDLKIKTIWSPEKFVKSDNLTIDVAMDELRKVVIDCISCWGNEYNNILLNLSGGLDSSLVATILRKHTNTNIYGLNLCFDSELGNEERYARDVSNMYEFPHFVFKMEENKFNLEDKLSIYPIQYKPLKYGLGFEILDKELEILEKYSIDSIFSGCAGDVLFQTKNSIFIAQDYFRDNGLKGYLSTAIRTAELTNNTIWAVFKKTAAYILFGSRRYAYEGKIDKGICNEKYKEIIDNKYLSHPWIENISHINNGKKFQIFCLADSQNFYTNFYTSNFVDNLHPLLSQPIMEYCLSIPSYILTPQLISRGLIREAFKDYLPESIYRRRTKSGVGSYYADIVEDNFNNITEILCNGNLVKKDIISKFDLKLLIEKAKNSDTVKMELFRLFTTEMWMRKVEGKKL